MFAPAHHAAMRHVGAGARRARHAHALQPARPLLEPGRASRASCSASSPTLARAADAGAAELGSERVWAVHGSDGLDEITTTGTDAGRRARERQHPPLHHHAGGCRASRWRSPRTSRAAIRSTTPRSCAPCSTARRPPIATSRVLNAAAALVVAGAAKDLARGRPARRLRSIDERRREGRARHARRGLERDVTRMTDILARIEAYKRHEIAAAKAAVPHGRDGAPRPRGAAAARLRGGSSPASRRGPPGARSPRSRRRARRRA